MHGGELNVRRGDDERLRVADTAGPRQVRPHITAQIIRVIVQVDAGAFRDNIAVGNPGDGVIVFSREGDLVGVLVDGDPCHHRNGSFAAEIVAELIARVAADAEIRAGFHTGPQRLHGVFRLHHDSESPVVLVRAVRIAEGDAKDIAPVGNGLLEHLVPQNAVVRRMPVVAAVDIHGKAGRIIQENTREFIDVFRLPGNIGILLIPCLGEVADVVEHGQAAEFSVFPNLRFIVAVDADEALAVVDKKAVDMRVARHGAVELNTERHVEHTAAASADAAENFLITLLRQRRNTAALVAFTLDKGHNRNRLRHSIPSPVVDHVVGDG